MHEIEEKQPQETSKFCMGARLSSGFITIDYRKHQIAQTHSQPQNCLLS